VLSRRGGERGARRWILPNTVGEMQKSQSKISGALPGRALRFPIQIPIFYRERSRKEWRKGITLNISKSGVLFLAEEPLKLNAEVKMRMQLPGAIHGQAPGELHCSGKVIRAMSGIPLKDAPVLGVAIGTYRLTRGHDFAPHNGRMSRR